MIYIFYVAYIVTQRSTNEAVIEHIALTLRSFCALSAGASFKINTQLFDLLAF